MDTLTHPVIGIDNPSTFPQTADLTTQFGTSPALTNNVGDGERLLSAVGGAALAIWGLSRLSTAGLIAAGVGAALVYRGMTGHCQAYDALNFNSADHS